MKLNTYAEAVAYIRKVGPTLSTHTPKMEVYWFARNIRPWLCQRLESPRYFAEAAYYYAYSQLLLQGPRHEIIELATKAMDVAHERKMTRLFMLSNALLTWVMCPDRAERKKQLISGMRTCKTLAMAWNATSGDTTYIDTLYNRMIVAA